MHEDHNPSEDEVIDDVLGENPRARELRLMRAALEERRTAFRGDLERAADSAEQKRVQGKLKALDRQIDALRQEEGIAEFVETSVRVTLSKAALEDEE
jgi:ABC-type phosphate transport system auxiliary subunit